MSFIAFKHFLAIVSLTFGTGAAAMAALPRIAQEPVLGLRYESAKVQFEPLPEEVSSQCKEYANTESWGSRLLVYALIHAGARTYYIVGGSRERLHPAPSESRYEVDDRGSILSIEGSECTVYGQAREVFDARFFEETPQPQGLGTGLCATFVRRHWKLQARAYPATLALQRHGDQHC